MRPGEEKYPHIFSPGKIGKLEAKNRIKYASTETNFCDRDGFVTDKEIAYMEAQAKGGSGIVTTQGAYTDEKGEARGYVGMAGIWDDKFLPGLKKIADVIRENDSLSCAQLMHCGRYGGVGLEYCAGPSAVDQKIPLFHPVREMSVDDIQQCVQDHVDGARRIVEAGYDMMEISGIVGYLIANFVSKFTNKRTDEYGGDIRGRSKIMIDILKGIRKEVGNDFPVGIRLCAEELIDDRGGNTPEESLETIKIADELGVDFHSVTAGWQESPISVITRDCEMGSWLYIAERVKKHVKAPVVMAYRLFVPEHPEAAIAAGNLDFWEACRPMIADPALPNKIAEDRQQDIIPCTACNLCLTRLFRDQPILCMVRPNLGHEGEPEWGYYGFEPAPEKRTVSIIGAGPGGLQCAAVAAERGHDVTVYEKEDHIGGQAYTASMGPYGDDELMRPIKQLEAQCKKYGVKFELNTKASRKIFPRPHTGLPTPGAIVLATGATPKADYIPGSDKPHVVNCMDVVESKAELGENIVIIGGTAMGVSTAQFLAHKGGHNISIIGEQKKLGMDIDASYRWRYMKKLREGNVQLYTSARVKKIKDESVKIITAEGEQTIPADTVVIATMVSNDSLFFQLYDFCEEMYLIGDSAAPRNQTQAIREGFLTGMRI